MHKTVIVTLFGSALGVAMACSAGQTGPGTQVSYGANGGTGPEGASGSAGSAGNAGVGGNFGNGGSGGTVDIGGSGGRSGSGNLGDGAVCDGVTQEAINKIQPADIIFVVDNSGSMTAEAGFVQQNLNSFSRGITMTGIDVQVVLI